MRLNYNNTIIKIVQQPMSPSRGEINQEFKTIISNILQAKKITSMPSRLETPLARFQFVSELSFQSSPKVSFFFFKKKKII